MFDGISLLPEVKQIVIISNTHVEELPREYPNVLRLKKL